MEFMAIFTSALGSFIAFGLLLHTLNFVWIFRVKGDAFRAVPAAEKAMAFGIAGGVIGLGSLAFEWGSAVLAVLALINAISTAVTWFAITRKAQRAKVE